MVHKKVGNFFSHDVYKIKKVTNSSLSYIRYDHCMTKSGISLVKPLMRLNMQNANKTQQRKASLSLNQLQRTFSRSLSWLWIGDQTFISVQSALSVLTQKLAVLIIKWKYMVIIRFMEYSLVHTNRVPGNVLFDAKLT